MSFDTTTVAAWSVLVAAGLIVRGPLVNMMQESDRDIYLVCVGGICFLDFALKATMSVMRLSGAPGEGNRMSFFQKTSKAQLLHAENVGPLLGLFTAHMLTKRDAELSPAVRGLFLAATALRFVMALRIFDSSGDESGYPGGKAANALANPLLMLKLFPPMLVGAVGQYGTLLGLIVTLSWNFGQ
jgi:hypothetical protein